MRHWVLLVATVGVALLGWNLGVSLYSAQAAPPAPTVTARAEVSVRTLPSSSPSRAEVTPSPEPVEAVRPQFPGVSTRAPEEWQGMQVVPEMRATCSSSSPCGMAMACRAGRCGPCQVDSDCGNSERCVLDHCVRAENVGCRSRKDCQEEGALCILSGYSQDLRGNRDMRAECVTPQGPSAYSLESSGPDLGSSGLHGPASPTSAQAMLDMLRLELASLPEDGSGKGQSRQETAR